MASAPLRTVHLRWSSPPAAAEVGGGVDLARVGRALGLDPTTIRLNGYFLSCGPGHVSSAVTWRALLAFFTARGLPTGVDPAAPIAVNGKPALSPPPSEVCEESIPGLRVEHVEISDLSPAPAQHQPRDRRRVGSVEAFCDKVRQAFCDKDAQDKLRRAAEADKNIKASADKRIADMKLAKDFAATIEEFRKLRNLAIQREMAYKAVVPQNAQPNDDHFLSLQGGFAESMTPSPVPPLWLGLIYASIPASSALVSATTKEAKIEIVKASNTQTSNSSLVPGSVIWRWIRLFVPEDAAATV